MENTENGQKMKNIQIPPKFNIKEEVRNYNSSLKLVSLGPARDLCSDSLRLGKWGREAGRAA